MFAAIGITFGLLMPPKTASAEPGILPSGQLPALTAEWWQWALSIPTSVNPQLDDTGQNCMVGAAGINLVPGRRLAWGNSNTRMLSA
jgi:hypothetical protein